MRKFYLVTILITMCTMVFADVRRNPSQQDFYLDRTIDASTWHQANKAATYMGVITRAGYAFNYDAVTYGASLVYKSDHFIGVTAGFDGYYIPNKRFLTQQGDTISSNLFKLPLWDVRAGLILGPYFAIGALCGKTNIGDTGDLIDMRKNAWVIDNSQSNVMYGGFITFILPISKYLGFNLDFAITNKTGFNIGGGINLTIPVK